MPVLPTDDQTLDELERQDQEELQEHDDEAIVIAEELPAPDISEELEQEIKEILVTEEPTPKQKNQMIPQHLIDKELAPEDLMDEGSI
jgi:hypothetical protein